MTTLRIGTAPLSIIAASAAGPSLQKPREELEKEADGKPAAHFLRSKGFLMDRQCGPLPSVKKGSELWAPVLKVV